MMFIAERHAALATDARAPRDGLTVDADTLRHQSTRRAPSALLRSTANDIAESLRISVRRVTRSF